MDADAVCVVFFEAGLLVVIAVPFMQALSSIAERLERSNEILRDILSQSDV